MSFGSSRLLRIISTAAVFAAAAVFTIGCASTSDEVSSFAVSAATRDSREYSESGESGEALYPADGSFEPAAEDSSGEASADVSADEGSKSGGYAVDAEIEFLSYGDTGSSIVEIPQFVTKSGESTKSLDTLNEKTKFLQDMYKEVRDENDGSFVEIRSYVADTKRYLQVTTTYVELPAKESWGDLITLAYDTKTDTAITPHDALAQSGIPGDQLSIDVHDAYVASGGKDLVRSTEMQGFELDDMGNLTAVYMKLGLYSEKTDSETQKFYRYCPSDQSITPLDLSAEEG